LSQCYYEDNKITGEALFIRKKSLAKKKKWKIATAGSKSSNC
jgi:hypothetical protein